jgi:ABC-type transport system involved in multi-copper enzyme maturation permease subunit
LLKTIIKKEILNNILSLRFLVTFILLITIISVTVFILTDDYVSRVDEYSRRQSELENYLSQYAHFNRIGNIVDPVQPPLSFFSLIRGLSSEANLEEFHNDPIPVMFPLIDLVFIVTLLMSLVALLFSYDSICGEKGDGTLRLMLSNDLPRSKIILGKIAGGTLTLLIPYIISLIIGMLIILINPRVLWKGEAWGALGLILIGSVMYVILFVCLGILISSRHQTSSASIMTSLFLWVLFILIIPNLSPYAASLVSKTPSRIKMGREISKITDVDRDELGRRLAGERQQTVLKKYPQLAEKLNKDNLQRRLSEDPDYKRAYEELTEEIQAAWDEANRIQGAKADEIRAEYSRKSEVQTRYATTISMLSPLSSFIYLATDLSSTGIRNRDHFSGLRERWWGLFGEFSRRKRESLKREDPSRDVWNSAVDVSDRPRFEYKEEALISRWLGTIRYFLVLFFITMILFSASYVLFVRYDIR